MYRLFIVFNSRLLLLIGYCVLFNVQESRGQQNDFDKRYTEISVRISALDGPNALLLADSLLSISANEEQHIKSHMLLANIHHSLGNRVLEFDEGLKAQKIANAASNTSWQARVSGFLATSFRHVGLMSESVKYLNLAEESNEKQKNAPNYLLTKINIAHERALHAMEDDAYERALTYLKGAKESIASITQEDSRILLIKGTNDQLLGVCYLYLNELDLADSLLRSSLLRIDGEENNLRPYIYRAQAEVAIRKDLTDSAFHYLKLAEPYLESSHREELKMLLYDSFSRYYRKIGDSAKAIQYQDLYTAVKDIRSRSAKRIADELVSSLEAEKQRNEDNLVFTGFLFFILISVLVMLLLYLVRKRKVEKEYYRDLVDQVNDKEAMMVAQIDIPNEELMLSSEENNLMISKETEERLVKELVKLEEEAFFLDKEISLPKLANRFGTNQRYLSYIIKKYRGKDFNSYVQHSRIHYIINRIRLDRELLDYKLSYLADMSGFSSHSKFSAVFKMVTGLPPSVFIHFRRNELNKKD